MPEAEDLGKVKIKLSSCEGNVLVITYNATCNDKSKIYRAHHFDRIRIAYKNEKNNVKKDDENGEARLKITFGFNISTDPDDKLSVRTQEKENIFFIQKFFFKLDFTITKRGDNTNPCEFRLEEGYSWKVWISSMPDPARAKTSKKQEKGKKQEKDKKQENKEQKKGKNIFQRKKKQQSEEGSDQQGGQERQVD